MNKGGDNTRLTRLNAADPIVQSIRGKIVTLRETPVILATDLAAFLGTTVSAVNQYRARNDGKFTPDYAFELTITEWRDLESQDVISSSHGGNRRAPWAYTEHGVAMMSMGMKSPEAVRLAKIIVDTFVQFRRGTLPPGRVIAGPNAATRRQSLREKIYQNMEHILDLQISQKTTLRDELGSVASKSVNRVKAWLDAPGRKNEQIEAEIAKLYAETRKIHAEADAVMLANRREAMNQLRDLREMAAQLDRDDVLGELDAFDMDHAPALSPPPKRITRKT